MKKPAQFLFVSFLFIFFSQTTWGQFSKNYQSNDTTYMLTYDHGGLIL